MDRVTRIGVSLEPELLERFDQLVGSKGYDARSEAIRDLIREELSRERVKDPRSRGIGTITLVYDHHRGGVTEELMEIQHEHHHQIMSSIHVHLDVERCLEVLIVKGKAGDLQALADELGAVKGVVQGGPVLMQDVPAAAETEHSHRHSGHSDE